MYTPNNVLNKYRSYFNQRRATGGPMTQDEMSSIHYADLAAQYDKMLERQKQADQKDYWSQSLGIQKDTLADNTSKWQATLAQQAADSAALNTYRTQQAAQAKADADALTAWRNQQADIQNRQLAADTDYRNRAIGLQSTGQDMQKSAQDNTALAAIGTGLGALGMKYALGDKDYLTQGWNWLTGKTSNAPSGNYDENYIPTDVDTKQYGDILDEYWYS